MSLNYIEAIVVGAFQGVTELFPVSSLGHSILVPALVGGQWAQDLSMTAEKSPYLAFLVAVHVATAVALLVFFWRDWVAVARGLVTSIKNRKITTSAERLAWLLILATIPVGIAGLALDHALRTSLGKPIPAAAFLAINGWHAPWADGPMLLVSGMATWFPLYLFFFVLILFLLILILFFLIFFKVYRIPY